MTGRTDLYEAFVQANQKYLEAVALEYQEGDVVLVHDYELMLLPAMIREGSRTRRSGSSATARSVRRPV